MATQLFKFVSSRDPKQATTDTGGSVWDVSQLEHEAAYSTSLFAALSGVMRNPALTPAEKVLQLNQVANAYTAQAQYLKDVAAFSTKYGNYAAFYDHAIQILRAATSKKIKDSGKGNVTVVDELYKAAKKQLDYDPETKQWLTPEQKLQVADNLLLQAISIADAQLVNKLSSVLKLLNFLLHVGGRGADVEVDAPKGLKLLTLPIGIPGDFKVPSIPRPAREPADDSAFKTEILQRFNRYEQHRNAFDEILQVIAQQPVVQASLPEEDRARYIPGKLNPEDKAKLSTGTLSLLADMKVVDGADLQALLGDVTVAGSMRAKELAPHVQAEKAKMLVGGNVVTVADYQGLIGNVIWNTEGTGGVIIGNDQECGLRFPFKIANLRVVEQDLLGYEPGYIAHVQNTLQGEFNEKTTRRLLRTEETFTTSTEKEVTDERDSQSTDRFTMERETSKTVQEDTEAYINGELSASYGPVSLTIGAGYSNSTSVEESNNEAISYSKDVIQRSLHRVIEKTKEERTVKTIHEFEETNRHGLDNRGGDSHVVGVYRWLDQLNKVTIKTYDKRMMIELMIPQPAKYHLGNFVENTEIQVSIPEPVHPANLQLPLGLCGGTVAANIRSHHDIHVLNYALLAAAYGATVDPYPQHFKAITYSVGNGGNKDETATIMEHKDIVISDGYHAHSVSYRFDCDNGSQQDPPWANHIFLWGNYLNVLGLTSTSPINFEGNGNMVSVRRKSANIGASFHITCMLTDKAYEQWQIKTYAAIMGAYEKKKAAYDNAVAEAKASAGIRIRGTNPAYNKQLIRTELKKQATYLMSHCSFIDNVAVYEDGTVQSCCQAFEKGQVIKFVDSVFEWQNMTYSLYDYFYAKKEEWKLLYNISDPDPLMNNFLKAGEARVVIPVAKGKEVAAINFLSLGKPWISDLLAMDIIDVADEFITEEPIEDLVIYDDDPLDPSLKPLIVPTALTILECSSGGIKPTKYLIKGEQCEGVMTPVITTEGGA